MALEEGRKRLGEGMEFLSKGLHDFGMVTSHLELQLIGSKIGTLGWMTSGSLVGTDAVFGLFADQWL